MGHKTRLYLFENTIRHRMSQESFHIHLIQTYLLRYLSKGGCFMEGKGFSYYS